jgi:glycosyl transferase family 25
MLERAPQPKRNNAPMRALKELLPATARFRARKQLNRLEHAWRTRFPVVLRYPRATAVTVYRKRQSAAGVARLDSVVVINLATRPDRLAGFTAEMERLGMDARRFEAVPHEHGMVGCTRSHVACLEEMIANGWAAMMVCEDDARFLVDRRELDLVVDRFLDDPGSDLACLAYNHFGVEPHDSLFLRATDTQTTACYVVKASIAPALLATWRRSAAALAEGRSTPQDNLDLAWKRLQRAYTFVIPVRRVARQEDGFSDIERRVVQYHV